jgi:hypothetical protein
MTRAIAVLPGHPAAGGGWLLLALAAGVLAVSVLSGVRAGLRRSRERRWPGPGRREMARDADLLRSGRLEPGVSGNWQLTDAERLTEFVNTGRRDRP